MVPQVELWESREVHFTELAHTVPRAVLTQLGPVGRVEESLRAAALAVPVVLCQYFQLFCVKYLPVLRRYAFGYINHPSDPIVFISWFNSSFLLPRVVRVFFSELVLDLLQFVLIDDLSVVAPSLELACVERSLELRGDIRVCL